MSKLIPAVDPYWTNSEWDDVWDQAEPPRPPRRPLGLGRWLWRLFLLMLFCGACAYVGMAVYVVNHTIDALDTDSDDSLAPFLAIPSIQANLRRDLTPQLQMVHPGTRSYLHRIENMIADSWQNPATIRAVIKHRVLLPGFGDEDMVADHVSRINILGPASLSIDFTNGNIGDVALRLCVQFSPAQAPWWQIHHIAWQIPDQSC